jgi:hypothetical protein
MKKILVLVAISLLVSFGNANAFDSTSSGADGPFDLGAQPSPIVPSYVAINGTTATVTLPSSGILNLTTVNVPSGWTVTFTKNAANTPVYMLATGDVIVNGAINVNGKDAQNSTAPGDGGPGGFAGGFGGGAGLSPGNGLGPGGGQGGIKCYYDEWHGGGGSYSTAGGQFRSGCGAGGATYGNERIIPFIGGSGGGGGTKDSSAGSGGGGGGGAILIASSGSITISGSVLANGGNDYGNGNSGAGSGGAIKLMADTIMGNGVISAKGGSVVIEETGGKGRIRLEAYTNSFVPGTDPPYTYGQPGDVFSVNEPTLSITSIAGTNVPANPTGSYAQPDITLPSTTTNPVTVTVAANYIPAGTTVTVSVVPQYGNATEVTTTLSGNDTSSTGSANVDLSTQYSNVITAQATFTMQQAMYYNGEKIKKVKVAATMGGRSNAVYITESGKEIKAKELAMTGFLK